VSEAEGKELFIDVSAMQPDAVFAEGGAAAVVAQIESAVRAIETDISSATGRGVIASVARRVSSTKARLDDMGKDFVADLKRRAKVVDTERAVVRDRLDTLRDEVRQPLTDWEQKQQSRIEEHQAELARLEAAAQFDVVEPTAAMIQDRLDRARTMAGNRDWEEFAKRANAARQKAIADLTVMLEAAQRREAERAELEELRRKNAEREQRDRDAQIAAQAAETARKAAEAKATRDAAQAAEAAQREQERIAQAARDAEERARKAEADRLAADERLRFFEENARVEAEQATEAVNKKLAELAASAEAARQKREANKRHRAKINNDARGALMQVGLSEQDAIAVVTAIATGAIPHVVINY
jgi:hypothetical protein